MNQSKINALHRLPPSLTYQQWRDAMESAHGTVMVNTIRSQQSATLYQLPRGASVVVSTAKDGFLGADAVLGEYVPGQECVIYSGPIGKTGVEVWRRKAEGGAA